MIILAAVLFGAFVVVPILLRQNPWTFFKDYLAFNNEIIRRIAEVEDFRL